MYNKTLSHFTDNQLVSKLKDITIDIYQKHYDGCGRMPRFIESWVLSRELLGSKFNKAETEINWRFSKLSDKGLVVKRSKNHYSKYSAFSIVSMEGFRVSDNEHWFLPLQES